MYYSGCCKYVQGQFYNIHLQTAWTKYSGEGSSWGNNIKDSTSTVKDSNIIYDWKNVESDVKPETQTVKGGISHSFYSYRFWNLY